MYIDIATNKFMETIQTPALTKFFTFITHIGDTKVLLPLSLILVLFLLYQNRKKDAIFTSLTLITAVSISESLKFLIQRARPIDALILETDPSFPSGHTLMSTLFFLLLIFLYKDEIKSKINKKMMITLGIILPILIGFSRLYLNVHWLTDVLAGLILGIIFALTFRMLLKKKG